MKDDLYLLETIDKKVRNVCWYNSSADTFFILDEHVPKSRLIKEGIVISKTPIFDQLEEKEKMKRLLTEMSDSILQTLRGNHVSFNTNSELLNRAKEFIE